MFKSLGESDYVPRGKKSTYQSAEQFRTHFEIGDSNYKNKYESVTDHFYKPQPYVADIKKGNNVNASSWALGDPSKTDKVDHFATETKKQFSEPRKTERVLPVRDKTTLLKSQYQLGEEKTEYVTTSKAQFYDKSNIKIPEVKYKEKEKYHILANTNLPKDRIVNASNFDFYNPHRSKNRTSNNQTDYPLAGVRLDPITRRILPTSYNIYEQNFKFNGTSQQQ